jgi:glyoxylase-like metal-dependent hydrolase (beta-lactamase superfamily II)
MKYEFAKRADNIFVIDAGMFGFENYMSIFLVQGKELALVDTGLPDSLEAVRAGIKSYGFSVKDLSYIFITHEHHDHSGNLGPLLRENPRIKAYIHPLAAQWVIDPSQEEANRRSNLSARMASRFARMEPVPPSRLTYFRDGDVFDLGEGVKLRIIFTAGHQPGGVVILEEKNKGLFINDLVGNCFADCDFQLILNPPRSDVALSIETLKKFQKLSLQRLFMGHFGISEKPYETIQRAVDGMQQLMDIGNTCIKEGYPEEIAPRALAVKMIEAEKLKKRGPVLYDYISQELVPSQAKIFANYYLQLKKK